MASFAELLISGVVSGLIIGLAGLAVTLVFGISRFSNAATGDMMTASAYAALVVTDLTGSLIIGGLAGVLAGMVGGILSYLLVFRKLEGRSAVSSLLASIGVAFCIRAALGLVFGQDQSVFPLELTRPMIWADIRVHPDDLKFVAAALCTLAVVYIVMKKTPVGRRMRAVADNPLLAKVSGIPTGQALFSLWSMAGAVAAVAGIILCMKTVVSPEIGWEMLIPAFAAAVLGGIGDPLGAVVAGMLIGVTQELATPFVGFTYKIAVSFIVLLLVLLVRPRGLFGRNEGVR